MQVLLKQNWFGPDGRLYRRNDGPTVIPTKFRTLLPKTAKVVGEVVVDDDEPQLDLDDKKEGGDGDDKGSEDKTEPKKEGDTGTAGKPADDKKDTGKAGGNKLNL